MILTDSPLKQFCSPTFLLKLKKVFFFGNPHSFHTFLALKSWVKAWRLDPANAEVANCDRVLEDQRLRPTWKMLGCHLKKSWKLMTYVFLLDFFFIGYFFFGDSCSWVTFVLLLFVYLFDVFD